MDSPAATFNVRVDKDMVWLMLRNTLQLFSYMYAQHASRVPRPCSCPCVHAILKKSFQLISYLVPLALIP